MSLDYDVIIYIFKRYGVNFVNVKNGESFIMNEDIVNYRYIVNNVDVIFRIIDKYGKEVIIVFK